MNNGLDIPLRDNEWFRCKHNTLNISFIIDGAIADLINQKNHSWNADLVRAYYPFPTYEEIMKIPLPKINARGDKLLWKHSKSGGTLRSKQHIGFSLRIVWLLRMIVIG